MHNSKQFCKCNFYEKIITIKIGRVWRCYTATLMHQFRFIWQFLFIFLFPSQFKSLATHVSNNIDGYFTCFKMTNKMQPITFCRSLHKWTSSMRRKVCFCCSCHGGSRQVCSHSPHTGLMCVSDTWKSKILKVKEPKALCLQLDKLKCVLIPHILV